MFALQMLAYIIDFAVASAACLRHFCACGVFSFSLIKESESVFRPSGDLIKSKQTRTILKYRVYGIRRFIAGVCWQTSSATCVYIESNLQDLITKVILGSERGGCLLRFVYHCKQRH